MKHLHHIIPRYLGGTDDPSNLVELTVEEHAEAHRILFEQNGNWQDEVAYKALTGTIGKEEIVLLKCSHKGERNPMYGKKHKKESLEKNKKSVLKRLGDENFKEKHRLATKKAMMRPEVKEKQRSYKRTEEHTKKLNSRFTKEYCNRISNSISRDYEIITPRGELLLVHNLSKYCKENNLLHSGMSNAMRRNTKYKGYRCRKVDHAA